MKHYNLMGMLLQMSCSLELEYFALHSKGKTLVRMGSCFAKPTMMCYWLVIITAISIGISSDSNGRKSFCWLIVYFSYLLIILYDGYQIVQLFYLSRDLLKRNSYQYNVAAAFARISALNVIICVYYVFY